MDPIITTPKVKTPAERAEIVLCALSGEKSLDELAREHALPRDELEAWRSLYLAGARGALAAAQATPRHTSWPRTRTGLRVTAGLLTLSAAAALAQAKGWPVELVTFSANTPAVADDVNKNFGALRSGMEQLKSWLDTKVGSVDKAGLTVSGDSQVTGKLTVTGATGLGSLTVNDWASNGLTVAGPEYTGVSAGKSALKISSSGQSLFLDGDEIDSTGSALFIQHAGSASAPDPGTRFTSFGGSVSVTGSLSVSGELTSGNRLVYKAEYRIKDANVASDVVKIDQDALVRICSDIDGCSVTLMMQDFDSTKRDASIGPVHFDYSNETGGFRTASVYEPGGETFINSVGVDGDSTLKHAMRAWNCFFTDSAYTLGGGSQTDNGKSMYLLNYNSNTEYKGSCVLVIDD